MSTCSFVDKKGTICGRNNLTGSEHCHLKSHYDTEIEYKMAISNVMEEFKEGRIPANQFLQSNVEADGACLFRSVANAIFHICGNDLETLFERFEASEYYQMLPKAVKDGFLLEYRKLFENFSDPDEFLDDEIETEVAIILQKMAVRYTLAKSSVDVTETMEGIGDIFGPSCTLQTFIETTHEITLDEYVSLYEKFAGEDDFYLKEKEVVIRRGHKRGKQVVKKVKVDIQERWGGLPELLMYAEMFDISFNVYIPQRLDIRTMKPVIAKKVCENTFYYLVQQINQNKGTNVVNLSLKEVKEGPHYEFLRPV